MVSCCATVSKLVEGLEECSTRRRREGGRDWANRRVTKEKKEEGGDRCLAFSDTCKGCEIYCGFPQK